MPLLPWYFQQAGRAPSHIFKPSTCQRHKSATKSWCSSKCSSLPLGMGLTQGAKPFGRCRAQRVSRKDLFLWKMHLLNGCLLLPYVSIHSRNLRNFHGSALRKSPHFSQTCLRWDMDCTRRSESWARLSLEKKERQKS